MKPVQTKTLGTLAKLTLSTAFVAGLGTYAFAQDATDAGTITDKDTEVHDLTWGVDGSENGEHLENTATVIAKFDLDGDGIAEEVDRDNAVEEVEIATADPDITMSKAAVFATDADGDGQADVDDVIKYVYTITNIGNVTLSGIELTDVHNGNGTLEFVACTPETNATVAAAQVDISEIAPGDVVVCTATYTVVQADIDTLQPMIP